MSSSVAGYVELSLPNLSANICAELAAGLSDVAGIKRRYELTDAQWNKLRQNPVFRGMLKDALRRLHGDMNAGKRITLKSEIALEDSIPLLHSFAHDPDVAIASRLEAIKQMTTLAGRTGKEAQPGAASGGGFNINIVVRGNEREREVIDVTSTPQLEAMDAAGEDSSEP